MDRSIVTVLRRVGIWIEVLFVPLEVRKKALVAPSFVTNVAGPLVVVIGITSSPTACALSVSVSPELRAVVYHC
jgi:hypothetical protein